MSSAIVAHDPSVAAGRRHLPGEAGEENDYALRYASALLAISRAFVAAAPV
jgi:hypothetical protein